MYYYFRENMLEKNISQEFRLKIVGEKRKYFIE